MKLCVYRYAEKKGEGMYEKSYSITVYEDEEHKFSCTVEASGFNGIDDAVFGAMAFVKQLAKITQTIMKPIT